MAKKTPEHILAKKREYYKNNRQRLLERSKQYYADNKEAIAERREERKKTDPKFMQKERAYHRKYYKIRKARKNNERPQ